jgi:alkanesulfonate monooxygenase SsuD/methylene tetrahydromethanopterin reductase-like flavin-dependent oxidoreductase (luciferase family)
VARFPDLALGTCVLVLALVRPAALADELAMLSNMTEQKLYIGLGRGTARYEYDAFRVDMTEARDRFHETWEMLDLAMSGEPFTYAGSTSRSTSPCASGRRPCASGSTSSARSAPASSTAVMAELGLAPMCTSFGVMTPTLCRRGRSAPPRSARSTRSPAAPLLVNAIVADTDEDAIDEAKRYMPLTCRPGRPLRRVRRHRADQGLRGWLATFERWKVLTTRSSIPPWTRGAAHRLAGHRRRARAGFVTPASTTSSCTPWSRDAARGAVALGRALPRPRSPAASRSASPPPLAA